MLPGVWIDSTHEVMYALASKITFICQMDFNAFPVDIQVQTRARLHAGTHIPHLIIQARMTKKKCKSKSYSKWPFCRIFKTPN